MLSEEEKNTVKQVLTDYLNLNGLRKTPERYVILDAIYAMNGHFDIEDLYDTMLNQEKFRVSRATLYNTLDLFYKIGLVIKHELTGASTQYEKSYGLEPHHHMVCTLCGKVTEFKSNELKSVVENMKMYGFCKKQYTLCIYGICKNCNNRVKRTQKKINKVKIK